MSKLIVLQWPVPQGVTAYSSTRADEVSIPSYDSLNLGTRCGDGPEHVEEGHKQLFAVGNLPSRLVWLEQVHGKDVLELTGEPYACKHADVSCGNTPGTVYVVMTADCSPVLFCNRARTEVTVTHAGWRGLCAGVLEETVACFTDKPENIIAQLGPTIGPNASEAGPEIHETFTTKDPQADLAFIPRDDKYLVDIYRLAHQRLSNIGIENIHGGDRRTFSESETFFPYRRDNTTGCVASFIRPIQSKESKRSGTCSFLFI